MLKQVPEESVSESQQYDRLRERVFDHQVFQRSRGKFGFLTEVLEGLAGEAESATDFLRRLDQIFADARTTANIYAQFVQDGYDDAAAEALQCLADESHRLPQEEVLSVHTVPYTLLMFEPEKTLYLLKLAFNWNGDEMWRFVQEKWGPTWRFNDNYRRGEEPQRPPEEIMPDFPPDLRELCRKFPSLFLTLREIRSYQLHFRPEVLGNAHKHDVLKPFLHAAKEPLQIAFCDAIRLRPVEYGLGRDFFSNNIDLFWHEARVDDLGFLRQFGAAYLLKGDRSNLVSLFPRKMQDRIATWQFQVPDNIHPYDCQVGLHIEAEHERWRRERPSFCSKNLHSGWGAMMLYHDRRYARRYELGEEVTRITLQR